MPGVIRLDRLLAHALIDFNETVGLGRGDARRPSLVQWSNFLRVMPDEGLAPNNIALEARVSLRAIKSLNRIVAEWIEVISVAPRKPLWRLTVSGLRAREAGRSTIDLADAAWRNRIGDQATASLRRAAEGFVRLLELELPWYPIAYGLADGRATGGRSVAATDGPPRLPAHGADWRPVVRAACTDTVGDVLLYGLLSQAYMAYQIEYEQLADWAKDGVDSLVRAFPTPRVPLAELPARLGVNGSGRTGLERHGIVRVETARGGAKMAVLTSRGLDLVEGHDERLGTIERDWRARYGDSIIDELQASVDAVDARLPQGTLGRVIARWWG